MDFSKRSRGQRWYVFLSARINNRQFELAIFFKLSFLDVYSYFLNSVFIGISVLIFKILFFTGWEEAFCLKFSRTLDSVYVDLVDAVGRVLASAA